MADDVLDGTGPAGALKRPRFETGDYLFARDLAAEQDWRRQRLRRHNRHLHGWGIVCGLRVAPALDPSRPWTVVVCPGYAIGPFGDEILVGCSARLDLRDWLWSRPSDRARLAYVATKFAESPAAPRSYRSTDCGCDDDQKNRISRVGDRWRIEVLWTAPDPVTLPDVDMCHDLPPCRPCPPTPYVILATVRLPSQESTPIQRLDIDLSVRTLI
jgi:hypothetical protein